MISVIESADWKKVSAADNCRPKTWRRLSSHSSSRLEAAADFVKFDPQSRRVFVTKIRSDYQARLSVQPSSSKQKFAASARSSDEVFEGPVRVRLQPL